MSKKQDQLDYQAIKLQKACSGHIPIETAYAFLNTAYKLGRKAANEDIIKIINANNKLINSLNLTSRNTKHRKISEIKAIINTK